MLYIGGGEVKIEKQVQKNCISRIKELATKEGYKKTQNTIYKVENENIVFADFLIVESAYLVYRINIKKQSFDKIFWQIMRMEENIKRGIALQVNGAFAAPAILIAKGKIELSENIDTVANNFLQKVHKEITEFKKNNLIEYVFTNNEIIDAKILQCLSYIDLNMITKAKEIAKDQLLLGDKGRFEYEGKGFFELVLSYSE